MTSSGAPDGDPAPAGTLPAPGDADAPPDARTTGAVQASGAPDVAPVRGGTTTTRARRRRGSVALPSLAAGVLLALSVPPWGWWPLAFAGAAVLYWRLAGLPLRTRFLSGWLAGLGCFVPGLFWATAFNWYGAAILMVAEALFMGVAAALVPPERGRPAAYAGAFTLMAGARLSFPFGGVPLGGVFLGQAGGPLLGTTRIGGPLLLTAVVWLAGAGFGELAGGALARRHGAGTGAPLRVGAALVVAVVALGFGAAAAPDGGPTTGTVRVASVQGGGRRGVSAQQVNPATVFAAQLTATGALERLDGATRPQLVIWPEDVVALGSSTLASSPDGATMASVARRLGATVLAGVTEDISRTAFLNEVVAWGPSGRVVSTYEKVHRVPFGEYVPYRSFFAHLANLSKVPRDAVPGHGTGLVPTPVAPLGVMISYEVFFADRGRSPVQAGARLLVVPTNTSSYATSQVPSQEVAADRVQAVAEGRNLVQAAPTGFSTVVTARGDVLQRTVLGRPQVLLATVGLRTGDTLYERLGDLPFAAFAAAAVAGGWLLAAGDLVAGYRRRRRRAAPQRS